MRVSFAAGQRVLALGLVPKIEREIAMNLWKLPRASFWVALFAFAIAIAFVDTLTPEHYRRAKPSGVTDVAQAKCSRANDSPVLFSKREESNGFISYELRSVSAHVQSTGRFKAGEPSEHSTIEQAMDEYSGSIPAVLCLSLEV